MQERINDYVKSLKVKDTKGYETPARICAEYFDGLGIDAPNADDWQAFKEYFMEKYEREKGKEISNTTLEQNYVSRGKAFYRWCALQSETLPVALPETSSNEFKETSTRHQSHRVNFLLSKEHHEALMSLAFLKDETLTEILTEAIEAYIREYSEKIAVLKETRRKLRED